MRFRRRHLALIAALLFSSAPVMAEPPKAWAYMGWWMPESWRAAPLAELDRFLFFHLTINDTGAIAERNGWPENWVDLRDALKNSSTPLDLTLTLFDVTAFDKLFSSPEATQRLLDECLLLASHADVAGLQLDFEIYTLVPPQAIAGYREFIVNLSKGLHQLSSPKNLSVFFPMGSDSQLYDAPTLQYVDHLVLQGYDAHWKGSKNAGPVAPLVGDEAVTWKKAVAQGLSLGMPKDRMLLGFPLYGYEWQVKNKKLRSSTVREGVATTFARMPEDMLPDFKFNVQDQVRHYGASQDPVSGSSYYQFKKENGDFVEGWFEDWWSLNIKTDYLVNEKLGGIAFFMLGYDNGQLVDYFLKYRRPQNLQSLIEKLR